MMNAVQSFLIGGRQASGGVSYREAAGMRNALAAQNDVSPERDPNGTDPHAPGAKLDAGKLRPWLMLSGFSRALQAVSDVTTKGATKYTPNGWATVPNGQERYMEAFGRHMLSLGTGEVFDEQTSCMHKAQMIWNLMASLELELREASGVRTPGAT